MSPDEHNFSAVSLNIILFHVNSVGIYWVSIRCRARCLEYKYEETQTTLKATVCNLFHPITQGEPCVIFIQYTRDPDQQVWCTCLMGTRKCSHREEIQCDGLSGNVHSVNLCVRQILHSSFWRAFPSPWRYMTIFPFEDIWKILADFSSF